jgi:Eukaryotic aspartyl protease
VAASFISDTASNGLVGLAFSKLNTIRPAQQNTFFANVAPLLSSSVFTANLKHGTAGGYEFGTVDTTQFSGSLTTVPISSSSGFWEFTSTQIAVGTGAAQTVTGGSGTAIADTGTSLMIVDPAVVSAYWGQVSGAMNSAAAGGVVFPCSSPLPDFSVAVGSSYMATISGSLLNFAQAGSDSQTGEACKFPPIFLG